MPALERLAALPVTVLAAAAAVTIASAWALPWVGFDYNLLNLQAEGRSRWHGRSGFSPQRPLRDSTRSLPPTRSKSCGASRPPSSGCASVSEVDSVLRLIPEEQGEKIEIIKSFAPLVAPVRVGRSSPVDLDRLTQTVRDLKRRFDIAATEAAAALPEEIHQLRGAERAPPRAARPDRSGGRRARPHPPPGPALPRLRRQVPARSSGICTRARSPSPTSPTRCGASSSARAADS